MVDEDIMIVQLSDSSWIFGPHVIQNRSVNNRFIIIAGREEEKSSAYRVRRRLVQIESVSLVGLTRPYGV
jgi:hypothetical protein